MLKVSPNDAEALHRLVEVLCANYDEDGNCVLLDDGEAHRCVLLLSMFGIHCKYFKDAVLPADQELYEKIKNHNKN